MDFACVYLKQISVTRFFKNKTESVYLSFKRETLEIVLNKNSRSLIANDLTISLHEIKEIRPGKKLKEFQKNKESKKLDEGSCFTIFYGDEFVLKSVSIAAKEKKEAEDWVKGLNLLTAKDLTMTQSQSILRELNNYQSKIKIWMLKEFEAISNNNNSDGVISLKHLKNFTNKVNLGISTNDLQTHFDTYSEDDWMKFDNFSNLARKLLHNNQIFTDIFGESTILDQKIEASEFESFLKTNNGIYNNSYLSFTNNSKTYLTAYEAVDYLFSRDNEIWSEKYSQVYQEMDWPLSQYWIDSSHNTYLTGGQLSSVSSVEAYARALRQGCRCIELDTWDSVNGPVITHGHTMTSKILFEDVIQIIKEHAFVASEYPVILSIENHCGKKQQKFMARRLHEVFGKDLVKDLIKPLSEHSNRLPSPKELKRKILLKGKKLPREVEANTKFYLFSPNENSIESGPGMSAGNGIPNESSSISSANDFDISDTIKAGKMFLRANSKYDWEPYFFALTSEKLSFTQLDEEIENECDPKDSSQGDELHVKKKWYHGKIVGGAPEAEKRVKDQGIEGCFLVRESSNLSGSYVLDILSNNKVHHIRLLKKLKNDHEYYGLVPNVYFPCIYTLVWYYKRNPLEGANFRIERFTCGVPQPEKYINEPWFFCDLIRKQVDDILKLFPINGVFLVRRSKDADSRFVISFRVDNIIKHCRIKEEGKFLLVSCKKFQDIVSLVKYYEKHVFYKGVKLAKPLTREIIDAALKDPNQENLQKVYADAGYCDTFFTAQKQRVIALVNYSPKDPKFLKFKKGDEIVNVTRPQDDDDWWLGDLGDQIQLMFPSNMVREVSDQDGLFGNFQNGSFMLGNATVIQNPKTEEKEFPYILSMDSGGDKKDKVEMALTMLPEAMDWKKEINEAHENMKNFKKAEKSNTSLHKEFSRLIVYLVNTQRYSNLMERERTFKEIVSFSELNAEKYMYGEPQGPKDYVWHHQVQLSRIYPKFQRVNSTNFNPVKYWNVGVQMVALNYQTPDKAMHLNQGRFKENGNCGYVLKPNCTFMKDFDPTNASITRQCGIQPFRAEITIIAARHLVKSGKGIISPLVEIEICGAEFDNQKHRTNVVSDNGLNPFWKKKFQISLLNPDLALIRFSVHNEDFTFQDSNFMAHATYPIKCLLTGYRSIPLLNGYGEEMELSALLVHYKIL